MVVLTCAQEYELRKLTQVKVNSIYKNIFYELRLPDKGGNQIIKNTISCKSSLNLIVNRKGPPIGEVDINYVPQTI